MKKIIALLVLIIMVIIAFAACKTPVHCDAYKSHRTHSKY